MDPRDAVQHLLSQDTFHEVKSKRERRKEMRETQGPNTRVDGCPSNRGVRDSSEHSYGRSGSILNSCNELGKAAYKKENDSVAYMLHSASSKLHSTGQTLNEQLFPPSNFFDADYRRQSIGPGDVIDSSMPPSHRLQSSWVGSTVEHDIVKMGRPKSKGSQM
ncbi:GBF-interacting protein 1-like [Hibiscus syriacus]|uniref:GBF-interacting protein 1-like n=1 Tax=Hibiscus syriacus TaxID=106335 RepID=UPI0019203FEA|nr:GBF-interacting protein 1-like [Hibiscus syriacus]